VAYLSAKASAAGHRRGSRKHNAVVAQEQEAGPKILRHGFDSFFFLVGWSLWKERNARTIDRRTAAVPDLAASIFNEVACWCAAGNRHLGVLLARV
jgi:hypothetical protein